ncbi:poly polymerase [Trichonephila clavipes]|nr:poly polymerase [Trichonephila clavipes]
MIPAYNQKRCAAFPFETGIHFRRKTDFFPEEDTTTSYSGFEPEPTRLQAEKNEQNTENTSHAVSSSKDFVALDYDNVPAAPIMAKAFWNLFKTQKNNMDADFDKEKGMNIAIPVPRHSKGGFVGYRSRASSKHLPPPLPVDELDSSGVKKGLRCTCKLHVWVSGLQRNRPDVDVWRSDVTTSIRHQK